MSQNDLLSLFRKDKFDQLLLGVASVDGSSPADVAEACDLLGRLCFELERFSQAGLLLRLAVRIDGLMVPGTGRHPMRSWSAAMAALSDLRLSSERGGRIQTELQRQVRRLEPEQYRAFRLITRPSPERLRRTLEAVRTPEIRAAVLIGYRYWQRRAVGDVRQLGSNTQRNDYVLADVEEYVDSLLADTSKWRIDQVMGLDRIETTVLYHRAAMYFDSRRYSESRELIERLRHHCKQGSHIAADLLDIRLGRALGLSRNTRRRAIQNLWRYLDALHQLDVGPAITSLASKVLAIDASRDTSKKVDLLLKGDYGREQNLLRPRVLLLREEASLVSEYDVSTALEFSEAANKLELRNDPRSHEHLRYLALLNERAQCESHMIGLLEELGIAETICFRVQRRETADRAVESHVPDEQRKAELEAEFSRLLQAENLGLSRRGLERRLLGIGDCLRAMGRNGFAVDWFEAMAHAFPSSGIAQARWCSLRTATGSPPESSELRPGSSRDLAVNVAVELARSNLARGNINEAVRLFNCVLSRCKCDRATGELCARPNTVVDWMPTRVDAWSGLIDCERIRRDYEQACIVQRQAIAELAPTDQTQVGSGRVWRVDETLTAEIQVARGWVECQLGEPMEAIRLHISALKLRPYLISGWIGLVRALRLVGRYRAAQDILVRLLGHPERALRPVPYNFASCDKRDSWFRSDRPLEGLPSMEMIHAGALLTELGWCQVDQDHMILAEQTFHKAHERAEYLTSVHRGLLAAMRSATNQELAAQLERSQQFLSRWHSESSMYYQTLALQMEVGRLRLGRGDRDEAQQIFEEVAEAALAGPDESFSARALFYAIADAYLDAQQPDEAAEILERVESFHPATGESLLSSDDRFRLLSCKLLLSRGRPDLAQQLATERTSYFLRIARLVTRFEAREYDLLEQECDDAACLDDRLLLGPNQDGSDPGDFILLIKAWAHLAQSELIAQRALPADKPGERMRRLAAAEEKIDDAATICDLLDGSLTDELHLQAIVLARYVDIDGKKELTDLVEQHRPFQIRSFPLPPLQLRFRASHRKTTVDSETAHHLTSIDSIQARGRTLSEARRTLERASDRRPEDPSILRDLAMMHVITDNYTTAANLLYRARKADNDDPRCSLISGLMHWRQSNPHEAIREFRSAVATDPADLVHHRALTWALHLSGDHDGAVTAARHSLSVVRPPRRAFNAVILHSQAKVARLPSLDTPLRKREQEAITQDLREARRRFPAHPDRGEADRLIGLLGDHPRSMLTNRHYRTSLALGAISILCLAATLLAVFRWSAEGEPFVWLTSGPYFLAATGSLIGLLVYSILHRDVSSISTRFLTLALREGEEIVDEVVHVDLDLSASRLLRVSGFSNHRPGIPFDVVDADTYD